MQYGKSILKFRLKIYAKCDENERSGEHFRKKTFHLLHVLILLYDFGNIQTSFLFSKLSIYLHIYKHTRDIY